jgi:hypothetical protein
MTRRPAALHLTWNVDLTISIRCNGRVVLKTRAYDAHGSAKAFCTGWFGEHPHRIRWTFVRSKKAAA